MEGTWKCSSVGPSADTLYEANGRFVADTPGSHEASRRCCVFSPDPGRTRAVPSAFRMRQSESQCAIREGIPPLQGGLEMRWGWAGKVLRMFEPWSVADWLVFEHSVSARSWGGLCRRRAPRSHCERPLIVWHPHGDTLATLSHGAVSVHMLGDAFTGSSTQYLHGNQDVVTLAWQPNNLQGALAVGGALGVSLWRRSSADGWSRAWALQGEAFACTAVAWSPDGRCVASTASEAVHVWFHSNVKWCATLRRRFSGTATNLSWSPDGALLAVSHEDSEGECSVRLWSTRTWEIVAHVGLRGLGAHVPPLWCSSTLIGVSGHLFELGSQDVFNKTCDFSPVLQCGTIEEVAVCPRTWQRIAVRVNGDPRVLIFERGCEGGWKQDVCGSISAVGNTEGGQLPQPLAIAFSQNYPQQLPRDNLFEGSLLAVLWEFAERGREVRTYPMHFLPQLLLQKDGNVLLD